MKLEVGKCYVAANGGITTPLRVEPATGLLLGELPSTGTIPWFPNGEPVNQSTITSHLLVKEFVKYSPGKSTVFVADQPEGESTPEYKTLADEFSAKLDAMSGEEIREAIKSDPVNHPSHYTRGGIEAIDGIESAISELTGAEAWLTANILKYLWRWRGKNGLEDLHKAKWYLNRLISKLEEKQ